jgi:hypothetical protein
VILSTINKQSSTVQTTTTMPYTEKATGLLVNLRKMKAEMKALKEMIEHAEHQLAIHKAAGDLDELQSPDNENTIYHDGITFVFCPGRLTWDYSKCPDIVQLEEALKEKKEAAKSVGKAGRTIGKPFWSVKQ